MLQQVRIGFTLGCALTGLSGIYFQHAEGAVHIEKAAYNAWPEAFTISNGKVETVVVPAVGRVMQFRFAGEKEGPFWENRALDGKGPDSQSVEWVNFGGDKTWPSPQNDWAKTTGRAWPPPRAFDSIPVDATQEGNVLVLRSKIDPNYGIRTERRITLSASEPEMKIETIYRKVEGAPIQTGIWIITQLRDPEKVFIPVPKQSLFPAGYNKQSDILPADLQFREGWVSCTRSPKDSTKIGCDGSDLIWGDKRWIIAIHAERERAGDFPDKGSSAEVYTNPNPNKYVELEMLGPLHSLKQGDSLSRSQTYRLYHRNAGPLEEQVRTLVSSH
jgi:hypothetical protein